MSPSRSLPPVVPTPAQLANELADDPVPAEVRVVIELFANQLAKVSFPEIDATTLRNHADALRTEALTVARAREALDGILAAFTARRAALIETASRAVAYARIYSESHPALAAAVAAIADLDPLDRPVAGSPPVTGKRRGRPPRRGAELFDATLATPVHQDPIA